ncbi:hypothetical protein [Streptomyces sp. NRRL S-337]|uniref:hypothetical protein n=1 Tax=Streptomyces sp. NRRL S-337 TaxID=1463900 RepID=UPI001F3D0114|nr:hypothetical protein [Streptomyces sp. NRRL S-337]
MVSTLVADRVRWRRERSERDRDALRTSFMEYLGALAQARDAFTRAEPSQVRIGRGHIAVSEYGVYTAQHQLELVAPQLVLDRARQATLAVLDFHDAVVAGHDAGSDEYLIAWRAVGEARSRLVEAMQTALRRY